MLLSLFISFLLARRFRWKIYVILVAVIVALVSTFSTFNLFFYPHPEYLFLTPPALQLSFPFHVGWREIFRVPPMPPYYRPSMLSYALYFLQFKLGELRLEYHTTKDFYRLRDLIFSSFLLINLVGAILGYAMSKIRRIREWKTSTQWNLLGSVLGMTLLGCLFIMLLFYKEVDPLYGVLIVYGEGLLLFGILILAIVVGRILWSKISEYKHQARLSKD